MHRSGEMMYISALGTGVIVLNSQRVASDLLDKRSNIYSGRPRYISANEYLTENLALVLSPYGDLYAINTQLYFSSSLITSPSVRRFRRVTAEGFSKSASQSFYPIQNREAIVLTLSLMNNPTKEKLKNFQRHTASIMFSVNYDLPPVEAEDDPRVVGIQDSLQRLLHEMQPGARLVEYFPWLRYVPSRCVADRAVDRGFPQILQCRFAKWKRDAQHWFIQDTLMLQRLLDNVSEDLVCARCTNPLTRSIIHVTPGKRN
jgi:hypothetical protein